jgi:hypothetical protein
MQGSSSLPSGLAHFESVVSSAFSPIGAAVFQAIISTSLRSVRRRLPQMDGMPLCRWVVPPIAFGCPLFLRAAHRYTRR